MTRRARQLFVLTSGPSPGSSMSTTRVFSETPASHQLQMLCEYTKFSAIFRLPLLPMRLSSVSHTLKSWQGFMAQVFVITSNHGSELSGLHLYK